MSDRLSDPSSDPFENLKHLADAGLTVLPLPAAEVLRLGDRRRRRRIVLQAAGAALAVVVVVSGGLFVGDNDTNAAPDPGPATQRPTPAPSATRSTEPVPTPRHDWVTEIPQSFPLMAGLPEPGGDVPAWDTSEKGSLPWQFLPCGTGSALTDSKFPGDQDRADATFVHVQPPAESHSRQLVLYKDADAASRVVEAMVTQTENCGPTESNPGISEFRWEASEARFADQTGHLFSGGAFVIDSDFREPSRAVQAVVQVGNAVLVAGFADESSIPDPADLSEADAAAWRSDVAVVAAAMCIFAVEPCTPE
jgi:hypothetical protein